MIDNIPFDKGFNPQNYKILCRKNQNNVIISFDGEWKGRKTFSIMNVWLNDSGCWAPGKGIQVSADQKGELIGNLTSAT